ncbi:DMT family transporter [Sporolactobacillus kofuensis]|uniref:DMT family transporter n=1 Tax=Sporolactobacillus kofuensis TaxID=269672 RepID=A0ABW1WEQ8_9BACL|nr:DMT family transporter [Sporolactobacillus kofuensis]MCO7176670.1 DMT family transporter [Sporolactobacillus kofuensis]
MNQKKADWMLVVVTLFWGSSYLFMKTGLDSLGVFNLIGLRFLIAFVITVLLFNQWIRKTNRQTFMYSFYLSIILLGVFLFIMLGVKTTSASKAGFLVSLTVLFVPLIEALLIRKIPERKVLLSGCVSLLGIFLLTGGSDAQVNLGDLYCILGALFNAGYIVFADRFVKRVHAIALGVWQMGFVGAIALFLSLFTEGVHLPHTPGAWISVLGLGILCSAAGYMIQVVAQHFTSSVHAGIIFTLEPVFAALFAFLFTGEQLSTSGYFGAALVVVSIVMMELRPMKIIRRFNASYKERNV